MNLGGIAGGMFGGVGGAILGNKLGSSPEKQKSKYDPRIQKESEELTTRTLRQARDMNNDLTSRQGDLRSQASEEGRRSLAGKLSDVRANASSRGLLYSGLRQGAESGAETQYGSDLANKMAQLNQESLEQNASVQNQALQGGLQMKQAKLGQYQQQTDLAAMEAQRKANMLNSIFGAAGTLGGGLLANKNSIFGTEKA